MHRLVLALALALAAVPSAAQEKVRLGTLKFAHYGAVSYMQQHCKQFGIEVEERMFAKGIDIFPALLGGEVHLAASAADAAIANRSTGAPVFVVAGFAKGGARLVAGAKTSITSVPDLKGKKVGVARGGAQELLLFAELSRHGLTWSDHAGKDVLVVYLPFPDLNQALQQKQIDAMCQSEPYSTVALAKGYGAEILKPYDTPMGEPVRVLVMTEKLYRNRDLALRVMKCFVAATKRFLDDPAAAERWVRDVMFKGQLTHEEYQDAMGNAAFTYDVSVEHVQVTTDLMVRYGVGKLSRPPAAASWVRLDLLETAKKELGVR